ncbi:MAG: alkaline phosphatase family protein [Pirellulales bacterium]|nr:alkaline phosphatase family protein [Pirellulales bacterium]
MIKTLISRFYGPKLEDFFTRLLYFFNTLDTYFLAAGIVSVWICGLLPGMARTVVVTIAVLWLFKLADFHPVFIFFSPLYVFFLFQSPLLDPGLFWFLVLVNLVIFVVVQVILMGVPDAIVARDKTVILRVLKNSVLTVAQTTVSLSISLFFSVLYALVLVAQPEPLTRPGGLFWAAIIVAAVIARSFRPRPFRSEPHQPYSSRACAERVIILNIDGCRLDRFYEAKLPFLTSLREKAAYFPEGIQTVYRALTNPAFASILTGTTPDVHGVTSNNLGQAIKVEALPDLVTTKLYGCIHIKHFSKPKWKTRIVSLPTHGIAKSDDIMLGWLKDDLLKADGTRLFVADLSEVDFLGHAYGSESPQYLAALKRADVRIAGFFDWLSHNGLEEGTVVIICSDHGMFRIDHSYLLFSAERYVPFLMSGAGIKKKCALNYDASIMDIASTVSYLLGIKYPASARGRVFEEAFVRGSKT